MPLDVGIAQLLETAGVGDFTYTEPSDGTEPVIVTGEQQEKPDAMIAVLAAGGGAPDRILGTTPQYTVISRDPEYEVCRDLATAVKKALHRHSGELDGVPVHLILADTEPIPLGRDATGNKNGRFEFIQTFTVHSHDSA